MAKHGKKYEATKEKAPRDTMALGQAIDFLKANAGAAFDETMEIALKLGLDPRKSEQAVRGSVQLPHGTGKAVRILVFAAGAAAEAAQQAGADFVGMDDLIDKIKEGWTGFDVAIATPEAMKEVRKLGRVLGPRGLMPNPKTGTVTDDTATAIGSAKAGKVDFRMDRHGNVHLPFGKRSFDAGLLMENARAALAAVRAEKPAAAKGVYIKTCTISSTMGVGIRVNADEA